MCQFASGTWNDTQKNWSAQKKEMSAIIKGTSAFHDHLAWKAFKIIVDNSALPSISKAKDTTNVIVARWYMHLAQYECTMEWIEGSKNCLADMLSREYLSVIKVGHYNPHITGEEWIETTMQNPSDRLWKPERFLQYEMLRVGHRWSHEDRIRQNQRAQDALRLLDLCQYITCHRINECTVIRIRCFPLIDGVPVLYRHPGSEIKEEILPYQFEEAFTDMLLWQNETFTHVYYLICTDQIDRHVRWQKLWAERFMPNPYAMWPVSLLAGLEYHGYNTPVTIDDLKQYAPWDYWMT